MADDNTTSDNAPEITFKVKTSGDSNHNITITESASVLDLKTKLATAEYENIPVERQRLIYSGRVMKNDEPLSTYKIKTGNTVHMVKSAASNPTPAPASSSGSSATHQQVPSNMSAGTANNPLAGLTGARYAGLTGLPSRDMFGPDGGMVGNMYDEEQMANMLNNPMVVSQMNEMLNNDQFIDMMVNSSPMLRNNPNAREILRSPMFRQMMTNPDALRSAARMQRMMNGGGAASAFPAPGATDNTPSGAASSGENNDGNAQSQQANPFGNMPAFNPEMLQSMFGGAAGGAGAGANPFAMFGQPPAQTSNNNAQAGTQATSPTPQTGASSTSTSTPSQGQGDAAQNTANQPPNPFAGLFGNLGAGAGGAGAGGAGGAGANPFGLPPMSPEAMQQMMQFMGVGSPGGSPQPPDNRPPEERYAEQLRQLNDMGFYDFDRNVAALRRSGGSVQGAIEHLLGGS